ncbi:MAG: FtsW/RodA/SpoVE family cell cycle protein [bacterium]|nr:FtsW/RodA/SpoVE family cell cycle protein [bacterium]
MFTKKLMGLDWYLIGSVLALSALGLMTIYSASSYQNDFLNFWKHALFLVIGIAIMIFLGSIDWRILRDGPYLIPFFYLLCLAGLTGLLFVKPAISGIRSWYNFGFFSIDPVEFVKLALIIFLAKYFSTRHVELYNMRHIFISGLYVFLPAVLIMLQPEFGSVIVLALLWIGALIVSGIKTKQFLIILLLGAILLALSWFFILKDYHKERIISFITPSFEPLDVGWNQAQAEIAIGSGGLWGKGFNRGTQIKYGFLPASQTDFIFAGIAEEWGMFGAGLVLAAFAVIIWRLVRTCLMSRSNFPRLFSVGLAIVIISHVIINIGMNLGLLPVVGIPLPLVSYGGSSLLVILSGLGLVLSMENRP